MHWRLLSIKATLINVLTPAFRQTLIEIKVNPDKIIFIPNASDFTLSDKIVKEFYYILERA
jgi:hypothetical protein